MSENNDDDENTSTFITHARKYAFDILIALVIVLVVGSGLFMYTGVWPPFMNVGSGSMEPNMQTGSVVLVMDSSQNTPSEVESYNGIVTKETGQEHGHESFSQAGDVIVFETDVVPVSVIHRAHFHVSEGEDWYERANDEYLDAENCDEQDFCPAPHDGFITKGDANDVYDQANDMPPVKDEQVESKAVRTVFPFW